MERDKIVKILDKVIEYCLYGLILFIPISKAAVEIFASLAILVFFIKKMLQPEFRFVKNRTHLYLLFFVIFSTLSLINSGPYLKKSIEALFFKWLEYIFIFLIVEDVLANRKRLRNVLAILLIVAGIVGIDGISQRFLGIEFLRQRKMVEIKEAIYAITAPFNHYNDFGAYLIVILSLAIALFFSKQFKKIYKTILVLLRIVLLVCLLLTFSRGSWLGFVSSLLLMLFLSREVKELGILFIIFIITVILIPGLRERSIFSFQPAGDADRFIVWQTAFRIIKENPFLGKGIGTFMDYFHKYTPNLYTQYAHNCFLQIWAETGIFSLLSFLGFLGLLFWKAIKAFRMSKDFLLLGLICGIFGFLVHSFFDTHLYSLQLSVLFWSMAGILCSLIKFQN